MADKAVSSYMRLFDGVQQYPALALLTHTPAEPLLSLCAAHKLFISKDVFSKAFRTLVKDLCRGNLVPKEDIDELAARIFLYCPRVLALKRNRGEQEPLRYVRLIDWLECLLGPCLDEEFKEKFANHHINFTHWLVTKAALPEEVTSNFLANLWVRGSALQCSHNQESFDYAVVCYTGSVEDDAPFDPTQLTFVYGQVKFKVNPDYQARDRIRPIGLTDQLKRTGEPYLVLLMDFGTEAPFSDTNTRVRMRKPARHSTRPTRSASKQSSNRAVDRQRWTLEMRGRTAETYPVLKELSVDDLFVALLDSFQPWAEALCEETRPCSRFYGPPVQWMVDFVTDRNGLNQGDVDMKDG
ncbi:hypothetical protein DACRYDRAFT_25284 [Dacryopinax primogenitus]|uniref:Uncharacterized protein n=1 Tax=Dacryopinax primogenitus (strain DJM 731) TaxID=1858805 RepID=M5FPM4_DACPD|nr:uncharacterized protein DACRYDRAFT_25284 [Dacryopinax primogenitus]EJT97168.1 hypothetical protein DACRYDRAFT_25284 [Dacryopinax primogenitus]